MKIFLKVVWSMLCLFVVFSFFNYAMNDKINRVKYFVAEENGSEVYVFTFIRGEQGKNEVIFPFEINVDAKDFLDEVEEIDAITSVETGEGYIRAFGGIGKNFKILANKSYEVSVVDSVNYTLRIK